MVFCIVFSLCGCEKNNAEEEETTVEATTLSTQSTEQTTLQPQLEKEDTTAKTTMPTAAETTAQTPAQTTEETTTTQTTTQTKAETITTTTVKTTQTAKQTTTQTTKQTTARTTEETTTETTLQTLYYPEEELDAMAENMPEIVFIMSLYYNCNIFGYFVTNTGEVKMFDFEPIAPGELCDIQDVYDRLDEAVCDEFQKETWRNFSHDDPLTVDKSVPVPEEKLKEKYKDLLSVDKSGEYWIDTNVLEDEGCRNAYGVRYNEDHEKEIILLHGEGEYVYRRKDEIPNKIYRWLKFDVFPDYPTGPLC